MHPATMALARVHGPGDVRLDQVPLPSCASDGVVVRVAACGVYGSDLGFIAQGGLGGVEPLESPLPIGHEFAGTVVAVGAGVASVTPGLRVAVNPDRAMIGGGGPDGAMAPYIHVTGAELGETLFALPDTLSFDEAALAEPLSVALHGLRVAKITAADRVAILGAGPIGLCTLLMLRHLGVTDVAIFDRVDERLDRAGAMGAALALNVDRVRLPTALARLHGAGDRFGASFVGTDVFVDCAGSTALLADALAVAKFRARVVVVALHDQQLPLDLWRIMANEITLSGSIADARAAEFGEAIAMLSEGTQDLSSLISHRFDFTCFHEALAMAADATRAAKVILKFGEQA